MALTNQDIRLCTLSAGPVALRQEARRSLRWIERNGGEPFSPTLAVAFTNGFWLAKVLDLLTFCGVGASVLMWFMSEAFPECAIQ